MDVFRLDRSSYKPDLYVEGGEKGYSSIVWTERYISDSEFEMKTPHVSKTMKDLPEGSLISHRETDEVMMVETHSISKSPEGYPELTIKGVGLSSFVHQRHLEGPYPKKKYKMATTYTTAEAVSLILWNSFVNPSENDVTRKGEWLRDIKDNVPNSVVTDSTTIGGGRKKRWLEGGQVGPQLVELLTTAEIGFRAIRPDSGPGRVVSVTTSDKGLISYRNVGSIDSLRWDIYNGVNRQHGNGTNDEVVFNFDAGHLSEDSYLWSIDGYKTMAFVISEGGINKYYRNRASDKLLTGLDRRVVWVDGGELDTKPVPDRRKGESADEYADRVDPIRAENAAARIEFAENLEESGEVALDASDRVLMMDAKIMPDCPYSYGVDADYYLGDTVSLLGQYEFDQAMRVAEYVRTEDGEGDRGYPGLVVAL